MISRRELLASALLPAVARAARPKGVLIESHVRLFANDPERFPYNTAAYKPRPNPVEEFLKFAAEARLDHAVIVHPEPYQDDHRYLEFCLTQGPKGFFKGTCLFDPIDPETQKRLQALVRRNAGRIVAFRIHEIHPAGTPSTNYAYIFNTRDISMTGVRRFTKEHRYTPGWNEAAMINPISTGYVPFHSWLRIALEHTPPWGAPALAGRYFTVY